MQVFSMLSSLNYLSHNHSRRITTFAPVWECWMAYARCSRLLHTADYCGRTLRVNHIVSPSGPLYALRVSLFLSSALAFLCWLILSFSIHAINTALGIHLAVWLLASRLCHHIKNKALLVLSRWLFYRFDFICLWSQNSTLHSRTLAFAVESCVVFLGLNTRRVHRQNKAKNNRKPSKNIWKQ